MAIVDSHCHVSPSWYEPIESLLDQMERNGVDHAVLVQSVLETDNDYQTECLRRFPGRFASVVNLDLSRPDAPETLARLAEQGASGVRLRPESRSPGDDPLAIWRAAERLGLAVSCIGRTPGFTSAEFAHLVETFPRLPIVVEHLGSGNLPDDEAVSLEARRAVFELARFPNVYVKIHGLGEFCRRALPIVDGFPFERPIPPLLEWAYAAFGAGRMMWGSDYPPVSVREGYGNALRLTRAQLAARSEAEQRQIFGETALAVFPVRG